MNQTVRFDFEVRTFAGEISIILEPLDQELEVLAGGYLTFDLPEGATQNQAEEIASFLNENILSVSYNSSK